MLTAEKLKFLRMLHNLTQKEVAEYLGVTRNYISQVENGKLTYSKEKCKEILNAIYTLASKK